MTTTNDHSKAEDPKAEGLPMCPYWHQLAGDFASMYPSGGYCTAGCHDKVKVMAGKTVEDVCVLKYGDCEGFQRVKAEQETKERKTPEIRPR